MPENKEEMYGLLAEFNEKADFMIENVLAKRYDFWDELSDNEKKLTLFYMTHLISMRAIYYQLDHELSKQAQEKEA